MVTTEEPLDQEQREQVVEALRDRKRGGGVTDRPLLLSGGMTMTVPELASADAQFLAGRKFSMREICAAFGVPEEVVCGSVDSKYNSMAASRLNFIENRVVPLCRRLEAAEEATIDGMAPGVDGWFDTEDHPVLVEARRGRLAAARAGWEMGVPFNELNRALGLGFQKLPWGDVGHIPRSMVEAEGK